MINRVRSGGELFADACELGIRKQQLVSWHGCSGQRARGDDAIKWVRHLLRKRRSEGKILWRHLVQAIPASACDKVRPFSANVRAVYYDASRDGALNTE